MESLIEIVDQLLQHEYPHATTELELLENRVEGFVFWDGFDGMEMADRVRAVSNLLNSNLADRFPEYRFFIFSFTPHEIAIIREEAALEDVHHEPA